MSAVKKFVLVFVLCTAVTIIPTRQANAVVWVVVKAAIKKVIKALDLQIQRMQNETIWLQNAQKTLENTLSKLKLDEISDWVDKHRQQYQVYFEQLKKVKAAISGYSRVRDIIQKQVAIVEEYKSSYTLLKKDTHLRQDEITYMGKVYAGIVDESVKNLDHLFLAIQEVTEMTDGNRLEIINKVGTHIDENLNDLRDFNRSNKILVLQRAKDQADAATIKALYNIK